MKVYLDWVGCKLNEAELERYAAQLRMAGHDLVPSPEEADLVIVNTCAVTGEAASDSRGKIRNAARRSSARIVATGCWATLDPSRAAALPNVEWIINNLDKDDLVSQVLDLEPSVFDQEPIARQPLPGAHSRTRSFIKVQDGCDNFCTYCITRLARGKGRSRLAGDVLRDALAAQAGGVQEVVLTGVHLGSWGSDFPEPGTLAALVRFLLAETDIPRIRLSSVEPWDLEGDFWSLWENGRVCQHVHLPLQSGSSAVLKRMARKVTPESFFAMISDIRRSIPKMAITTDVIAGFPGETNAEFEET
ncbi:MAG TPA: MiaB/RimO family radical SAM methylthiotransferase, partial [Anaerolineaceae bacterium]|nr:MiaB/RimO family radical SAM methylthiotransferase [Anaerolineaceae bacterium]